MLRSHTLHNILTPLSQAIVCPSGTQLWWLGCTWLTGPSWIRCFENSIKMLRSLLSNFGCHSTPTYKLIQFVSSRVLGVFVFSLDACSVYYVFLEDMRLCWSTCKCTLETIPDFFGRPLCRTLWFLTRQRAFDGCPRLATTLIASWRMLSWRKPQWKSVFLIIHFQSCEIRS